MAIRHIRVEDDPILRRISKEVKEIDDKLLTLLDDMAETMLHHEGAGLSAVQVGVLKRVFVVDLEEDGILDIINPVVLESSGEQVDEEGCLSLPDVFDVVKRPSYLKIEAFDRDGTLQEYELREFHAVVFAHEMDHLNGILYTDKIEREVEPSGAARKRRKDRSKK